MGLDDGEWIRDDAKDPAGNEGTAEEPEDDWPGDEWAAAAQPSGTPPPGAGKGRGHGGDGASVTAAISRATKITGAVRGIGSVKVADQVSAQITGTSGHLTATAIQLEFPSQAAVASQVARLPGIWLWCR
jgi:hypothetical protein